MLEGIPPKRDINAKETSDKTSSFSESSNDVRAFFLKPMSCSIFLTPISAGIKCHTINALNGYAKANELSSPIF